MSLINFYKKNTLKFILHLVNSIIFFPFKKVEI
jgi:hypothetical protein